GDPHFPAWGIDGRGLAGDAGRIPGERLRGGALAGVDGAKGWIPRVDQKPSRAGPANVELDGAALESAGGANRGHGAEGCGNAAGKLAGEALPAGIPGTGGPQPDLDQAGAGGGVGNGE